MDREVLLGALVALVCGPLAWVASPLAAPGSANGGDHERRAWGEMMMPLVPACGGFALLVGWALREPEATDERISFAGWLVVGVVGLIWIRAGARFVLVNLRRSTVSIEVVGLARPRIVVDPEVARTLDPDALAAAIAHEEAHLRHRDPLRIAIASVATDLQWP